ncbi:MAG TPA: hypothetical protein VFR06_05735 [Gallionellaceae bacterium]|nr:hypothetical protein [Gallionellaceae bacterium]
MDRKIVLGITGLIVALALLAWLLPDRPTGTGETLPWHITHPTPDTTRVLGVTLGGSTLGEAEQVFQEAAEISLFKPNEGKLAVEAFFEEVKLNGLKARIVVTLALSQEELQGMFERGLRMNATGSGKRITLNTDDLAKVRLTPITSLSYLPTVQLDEAVLAKRFGTPAERIKEKKGGAVHWLYPQHGLDIAVSAGEKPLLQYVNPRDFGQLRTPLLATGEILK